jgi:hypothetical protein
MAGAIMALLDRYQTLIDAGRPVDLDHVEESVATLCAQILALPESEGRQFLAPLATLLEKADRLQATLPPA